MEDIFHVYLVTVTARRLKESNHSATVLVTCQDQRQNPPLLCDSEGSSTASCTCTAHALFCHVTNKSQTFEHRPILPTSFIPTERPSGERMLHKNCSQDSAQNFRYSTEQKTPLSRQLAMTYFLPLSFLPFPCYFPTQHFPTLTQRWQTTGAGNGIHRWLRKGSLQS